MNRRIFLINAGALVIAGGIAAFAPVEVSEAKTHVYTGLVPGVAVGGYDPVAYFTQGKPVRGSKDITLNHEGAQWRFASEANRTAFAADPAKYAPKYGGHCAWAAAEGYKAKGDPAYWNIVDGRLYLNFNGRIQSRWERDIPGFIKKGDSNWPKLKSQS